MAKADARPKRNTEEDRPEETTVSPGAHDAPGLSPFERMVELTRRLVSIPPKELARAKRREEKKPGH